MQRNEKYEPIKTVKKFLWAAFLVLITLLIAYTEQDPTLYALVPLLEAMRNFVKHYIKK